MRRTLLAATALVAILAAQVCAQAALSYDPYYVLPGDKGGVGIDVGLQNVDITDLGALSDVYVMGKYSITDKIEAGARITLGFMNDMRADDFSDVVIGAKYSISATSAATVNITPVNEVEEMGLSVGYMQTMAMSDIDINGQLQIGLLDAYAPEGVTIALKVEPTYAINDKMMGYLDILLSSNTDSFGDNMALNLWPNLDYVVMEGLVVNAGVTVGLAGDMKQDDVGIRVAAIKTMSIE